MSESTADANQTGNKLEFGYVIEIWGKWGNNHDMMYMMYDIMDTRGPKIIKEHRKKWGIIGK